MPSSTSRSASGMANAVLLAVGEARGAPVARHKHRVDARHRRRAPHLAGHPVDRLPDRRGFAERRRVEGADELPGIGGAVDIGGVVDQIPAHRRAVERAREQPDDEAQRIALVAAHRQQQPFRGARRIGERGAVARHHPALGHGLAALRGRPDLAHRGDGGGEIHHHRGAVPGRDRDRQRVGAEQQVGAAPGRHLVAAADRAVDADHAVRERHRGIDRSRAGVVAVARAGPADAGLRRLPDRRPGRPFDREVTHPVVAVHECDRSRFPQDRDLRGPVDAPAPYAFQIIRQAEDPVRVEAGAVGGHHEPRDIRRVAPGQAFAGQHPGDEALELAGSEALAHLVLRVSRCHT